jgi:hypothetical protein
LVATSVLHSSCMYCTKYEWGPWLLLAVQNLSRCYCWIRRLGIHACLTHALLPCYSQHSLVHPFLQSDWCRRSSAENLCACSSSNRKILGILCIPRKRQKVLSHPFSRLSQPLSLKSLRTCSISTGMMHVKIRPVQPEPEARRLRSTRRAGAASC